MTFKDHFSGHAAGYAQSRPTYPDALFTWLTAQCRRHELAWDAGCGNGQAALALAARFRSVIATDPSAAQIAAAPAHARIDYRVEPAEAASLDDASTDLVTIAQALHWLEHERFHAEVRRVARPGAVVAAWCYGLSTVSASVDAVYRELYEDRLGRYWPPERVHIETGYRDLPFPFEPLPTTAPVFSMQLQWRLPQYLAYLRSWSATQRCLAETGIDAVASIEQAMTSAWGEPERIRIVSFPLSLRVGRR